MAGNYRLMPNESMILQESRVAHGGVMAIYTDDLMLTSLNLVCINKGMLGNTKNVFVYPLNQIKRFNGKPQVMMGKLSNGMATLDIYFINGGCESFNFQTGNKRNIKKWIDAIISVIGGGDGQAGSGYDYDTDDYDSDTLVGAFREVGGQFKDVGNEFLDVLGFKQRTKSPKTATSAAGMVTSEKISKKCMSCSAPLIGFRGQTVKCRYCDTEQTL